MSHFTDEFCVICRRPSTCLIQRQDTLETAEYCELHYGAWMMVHEDETEPLIRCAFRGHSQDICKVLDIPTHVQLQEPTHEPD